MEINNINKGKCKGCSEIRILNKDDLCIFCTTTYSGPGIEVKEKKISDNHGREIRSKSGDFKQENAWMQK